MPGHSAYSHFTLSSCSSFRSILLFERLGSSVSGSEIPDHSFLVLLLYISSLLGNLRKLRDKFYFLAPCRLNTGSIIAPQMGFIIEELVSEHREQSK